MRVYAVCGQSGEYSDRDEWIVAVFADHEMAKASIVALDQDGARKLAEYCALPRLNWSAATWPEKQSYMDAQQAILKGGLDPRWDTDQTLYSCVSVDMLDAPLEAK